LDDLFGGNKVSRPLGSRMVDWIANNIGTITKATETKEGRKTDKQTDKKTYRRADRQTSRETSRQT
jgi:hypothetical protein